PPVAVVPDHGGPLGPVFGDGGCADGACGVGRPRSCLRANTEYLLWSIKDSHVPPLLTTTPPGTPPASPRALGAPGTRVLLGDRALDNDMISGGRFTLALSPRCLPDCTFETNYFFLGRRTNHFEADSATFPILARPILNIASGTEQGIPVSFP